MIIRTAYAPHLRRAIISFGTLEGEVEITTTLVGVFNTSDTGEFDTVMVSKGPFKIWDLDDFDTMRSQVAHAQKEIVKNYLGESLDKQDTTDVK